MADYDAFNAFATAVTAGTNEVKKTHQEVSLVKVKGVPWYGEETKDPRAIRNLTLSFAVANNKNVRIERKHGIEAKGVADGWNPPAEYQRADSLQVTIDWPVQVSFLEAFALKILAGHDGPFRSITLQPAVPRRTVEPSYLFEGPSQSVTVGARTGTVSVVS